MELLSKDTLNQIGQQIRADVVQNFRKSAIQSHTHTLQKAVEEANIDVTQGENGFTITVMLADFQRPRRPGERGKPPSTAIYGPWVFRGHPAIFSPSPMTFRAGNGWIHTHEVKASRTDLNVFVLTDDQQEDITEAITEAVKTAALKYLCDYQIG